MSTHPQISETELAVLKVLWERGRATVREMLDDLRKLGRRWAYTTVQTILNRLQSKQFVEVERALPAHIYSPRISRESLLQTRLNDLADELCEGTASPLVIALVEGGRIRPEEIAALRQMLEQLDAGKPPETKG